jgi:bifunctional non-homologous end joining protein LigD
VLEGRALPLTSLDKVLWPRAGFTKGDLIEYYRAVAEAVVPHLRGRPVTLGRFPGGVEGRGFAQTECRGRPGWMTVHPVRIAAGQLRRYCVVDGVSALVWVANQNAIELHTFPGRRGELGQPGCVVFDLDPGPGAGLLDCSRVALLLRDLLDDLGLAAFAKTSGATGLHVLVPIGPGHGFGAARQFSRTVAERLTASHPRSVAAGRADGKIAVDWRQNSRMRTTVAPYSLRATDLPLASAPVRWSEVEDAVREADPQRLVLGPWDVVERVERHGDPLSPVLTLDQGLPGWAIA